MNGDLVYCNTIQELMEELQLQSRGGFSLIHLTPMKAVLLYKFLSIPMAHAVQKRNI